MSEPKWGEESICLRKEGMAEMEDWLHIGLLGQIKAHVKVNASQVSYCQRRK